MRTFRAVNFQRAPLLTLLSSGISVNVLDEPIAALTGSRRRI